VPSPATGHKAYLWTGGTTNTPTSVLATADFSTIVAGWNEVLFSAPVSIIAGRYYWAQVYFPVGLYAARAFVFGGSIVSVETGSLYGADNLEVSTGNGAYVLGSAGQAPATAFNRSWYGVDVLVDDGSGGTGPGSEDNVGISDNVVAVRSGLPSAIHASATVMDVLSASVSATAALAVGSATSTHTTRRSLMDTRIAWGAVVNTGVMGPDIGHDDIGGPYTLGVQFSSQWPVDFIGCNIYKPPNAFGTIPVRLWEMDGTELASKTVTWVIDAGGWVTVLFDTPVPLTQDTEYIVSYYTPSSDYAYSTWVFHAWDDVVPPLKVKLFKDNTTASLRKDASALRIGTAQSIPNIHTATNYYIDPIVEWVSTDPICKRSLVDSYMAAFVNGVSTKPFPIAVFFADPPFLQEYADMGINTLIAGGPLQNPPYIEAIKASGLDWWMGFDTDGMGSRVLAEDPELAAHVVGYHIDDEPDLTSPYRSPALLRGQLETCRRLDSTRPTMIGLSKVVGVNQTWYHQPQGSTMNEANKLWREWAALPDVLAGDFYTLTAENSSDIYGVWTYPRYTQKLRNLNEGRTPVYNTIETTSQTPGQPLPDQVVKATWASLIAGADGIIFFDHRFGSNLVTQDFAAMLHDPPMKAAVTALIVRILSLAPALKADEANLVTAWTSSNTTSGPRGGTYGVPMHYTTRDDGTHQYLFAMGIRPGATTATFTIPAWTGQTVTVLDESRTVTVSGAGVLTDSFPADYTVHLYQL
jgi:hypothetical protein